MQKPKIEQFRLRILKRVFVSSQMVIATDGKPGEAIVQKAEENGASLIVMGSRGLNAIRRTFTGSVSDYVLHHANIPVLVVPPQ